MRKEWKRIGAALAAGVLAAGLLAGCGGEEKKAATPAAGEKIAVKTVVSSTEAPLSWKDENGELKGYEYDVLLEVNKRLKNYALDIEAVPPETQDVLMESGEAKAAAGGYYINKQREENFLLPKNPIGASSLVIYVPKGEEGKYKGLFDVIAAGLRIVPLTPNGGAFRILTEWNEKNGKPLAEVPVQANYSAAEAIRSIKEGQYDVLITPNNIGIEALAKKEAIDLVALAEPIKVNPTVVIVNKKEVKLAEDIDQALASLRQDGTLAKISEKWYGSDLMTLLKK